MSTATLERPATAWLAALPTPPVAAAPREPATGFPAMALVAWTPRA